MLQHAHTFTVSTQGKGLYEITDAVQRWAEGPGAGIGLLTLYCRHTSASLLISENAARAVRMDLEAFFERIAPEAPGRYVHDDEGTDDMPAHLRAALTATSLSIPLVDGRLVLGMWQGVYLFEHRRAPHRREVVAHLLAA
jgi:secondary thiamine-phosphate synthase enzyme